MKTAVLTLFALALSCAWVALGSFRTMQSIGQAAHENNPEQLARNIDFPVLRENLKPQLSVLLTEKLRKKKRNGWAALGMLYSDQIADRAVDAIITPQGIASLMSYDGRKKKKKKSGQSGSDAGSTAEVSAKSVEREWGFSSPSEFVMTEKKKGKSTSFVLTRYGLGWKLTNILLPGGKAAD